MADRTMLYIFLIAILCGAILVGVPLYNKMQRNAQLIADQYNGYDFIKTENGNLTTWKTIVSVQGELRSLEFYYHPRDLQAIGLDTDIAPEFINPVTRPSKVYITLPDTEDGPTLVVAGVEISKVIGYQLDLFNIQTRSALQTPPETNTTEIAVVQCQQATENASVISFEQSDFNVFVRDKENPYCFRLNYVTPGDAIKVADRFVYGLLSIMN